MKKLDSSIAIVTGAGGAIGMAACRRLVEEGASVVLAVEAMTDRVSQFVDGLSSRSLAVVCDVSNEKSVTELVKAVDKQFGQIDLLINNAGVMGAPGWQTCGVSRPIDWDVTFAINVKGSYLCADAVRPHMAKRKQGSILNIASIAGRISSPNYPHYHASKAAVINLTQCLARQMAPHNVRVNAVSPALIWSQMTEETYEWQRQFAGVQGKSAREAFENSVKQRAILGREVMPEDIAAALVFLASDDAQAITGQTIEVNCGAVMV